MFRLNFAALLALAGIADALYSWNSPECQALEAQDNLVSESCVPPGSIPSANRKCPKCVYNEQCESNWCWDERKVCYTSGYSCYIGHDHTADCENCPSDPSVDPTKCDCDSENFPNNWVDCTDGSGKKFTVEASAAGSNTYTPKLSNTGGLASDDKFAIVIQCYHNKVRQKAGLQPVEWDDNLAKFAKNWSEHLCATETCRITHSKDSDRGFSAGENLYAYWGSIPNSGIPNQGKAALEGWYGEIQDYFYKGEGEGYSECDQTGVIGHFTQVMWESSTTIGCGYGLNADKNGITVSCNYQPAGNWVGQQAFDKNVFCKLKKWNESKRKYGKIHWCGAGRARC